MTIANTPSPGTPRRRPSRPPARYGFRRVVALLLLVAVAELVWRSGLLRHHATERLAARTVSAGGLPALAGPPVATRDQIRSELGRLVSAGLPVLCGGGSKPLVALTFDDGPGPYTQRVLEMLRHRGAHATFFIVA